MLSAVSSELGFPHPAEPLPVFWEYKNAIYISFCLFVTSDNSIVDEHVDLRLKKKYFHVLFVDEEK